MADAVSIPDRFKAQVLSGQRFGRWLVRDYDGYRGGHHHFQCVCDCGTEKVVNRGSLLRGLSTSCGCLKNEALGKRRLKDLTGKRFDRLFVLSRGSDDRNRLLKWICRCDCGTEKEVYGCALTRGLTRSCGCLTKELPNSNLQHGRTGTAEHRAWVNMRRRCHDPKCPEFIYYGKRGITVCERWRDSFINFLEDMGPKPTPAHSIERLDNDLGYFPSNCKWATKNEQALNRRPKGTVKPVKRRSFKKS